MNNQIENQEIDPELDIRLTAMVMGEASDFEIAQLEEQMLQRPELREWYKRLQSLHNSLTEIAAVDKSKDGIDWRLPDHKRQSLIELFEKSETVATGLKVPSGMKNGKRSRYLLAYTSLIGLAAAASVLICVGLLLNLSTRYGRPASLAQMDFGRVLTESAPPSMKAPEVGSAIPSSGESILGADSNFGGQNLGEQSAATTTGLALEDQSNAFGLTPAKPSQSIDATSDPAIASDRIGNSLRFREDDFEQEKRFDYDAEADFVERGSGSISPTAPPSNRFSGEFPPGMLGGLGGGGRAGATPVEEPLSEGKPSAVPSDYRLADNPRRLSTDAPSPLATPRDIAGDKEPAGSGGQKSSEADGKDAMAGRVPIDALASLQDPASPEVRTNKNEESRRDLAVGNQGEGQASIGKKLGNDETQAPASLAKENKPGREVDGTWQDDGLSKQSESREGRPVDGANLDAKSDMQTAPQVEGGVQMGQPEAFFRQQAQGKLQELQLGRKIESKNKSDELSKSSTANQPENINRKRLSAESEELVDEASRALKRQEEPSISGWENSANTWYESKKKQSGSVPVSASLDEKQADNEPFSTFSLHVSDVSFKLAFASLVKGQWPDAAKIRLEEFVNAFDYRDPLPSSDEKVACRVEQAIHPFLMQRNILRVSMRTSALGRTSSTPLRLTLLLDNSGSMERMDRRQTIRRAFESLSQQLGPNDQLTLISFSNKPRLLADRINGAKVSEILPILDTLPSEGGTNIEAALNLAIEKAIEQRAANTQNRIVLLTDGAVNLGDANPESLSRLVVKMRDLGIAFDAAGISAQDLNDEVLEALTRQGDGRYYLLDSVEAASSGFADQIAGALRPSAKNVKVQVEFNPQRVGRYKLLGFDKHLLNKEDFRNDKIDAAELAAAEAGVAVYQFEAKPDGVGDIGSVSVRFQDIATGMMVEKRWPIPYEANSYRIEDSTPSLKIATTAAMLAAKLRGEALGDAVDLKTLGSLVSSLPEPVRYSERVEQLRVMIEQARQISGSPGNE